LFVLEPDKGLVPLLSQPLRGKLHVHSVQTDRSEFFDRLAKLYLEREELVIDSPSFMDSRFLGALLITANAVEVPRVTSELCE